MYIPPHFAIPDPAVLHRIVRAHPLGVLVTQQGDGLDAGHLPFEFDPGTGPSGTLTAHVPRGNPLWQRCAAGAPVMVIFRGAEAFISPSRYPSKHESHRQVPTRNCEVIHAHGTLAVRDDERFVRGLAARLTRPHVASEPRPRKMSDSAPDFIEGNIVGIEVTVTSMVGKSKLGRNKEVRDRLGAAEVLGTRGPAELAQRMRDPG